MTESARRHADGPYPIRPITEDEFDSFEAVAQHAFHGSPISAGDRSMVLERFEFDRTLAAWDGSEPVGVTSIYSFQLSVPGRDVLPAAGVTFVAVLPTHRRRGVLSSLMRRQLADVRDRGEPLAVLWASESVIYSRYGYGGASGILSLTFRRGEGKLAKGPADGLRLRIADPPAVLPELAKVYDAVLPSRPGLFARNDAWWRRAIYDPAEERKGASPLRCLLAEDGSGPRGYALYSGVEHWADFLPENVLTVRELMATDPAASAALWADLLSRDLTSEFRVERRPVDDPLLYQLADPRRARPQLTDGLWVRIIDVPAALAGRRYSCPGQPGPRGAGRDPAVQRRPVAADDHRRRPRGRLRPGGVVRSGHLGGRPGAGRDRTRRGLPGRDQAGRTGRSRPGRRNAARRRPAALGRHGLGPRSLVPADLLGPWSRRREWWVRRVCTTLGPRRMMPCRP